ncbi:hypothetical protein OG723_44585 (plasmid) [Streptomyces sp. NBC_01278]|uniref:hypothetical protein n=1 Tax=Streptomyces sp. NBC_01278 TaxID=2903809 RepID=UPI002E2FBB89|nr:hypothetical protein [Streptomyces sp. NBC_01278]
MTNLYWEIVAQRGAEVWAAHNTPGADIMAGLPIFREHVEEFGLLQATHIAQMCLMAVVHEDAAPGTRAPAGTVDLDRLLPEQPDALTTIDIAEYLVSVAHFSLSGAMTDAEQQIASHPRARATVQAILNEAPHGRSGREKGIDILWELRDDPRAMCAVLALTGAALHTVVYAPA